MMPPMKPEKLTVMIAYTGDAVNIGGSITYRSVTVQLTPEQSHALALRDEWDSYGPMALETATVSQGEQS